jgi:hypothetical protein
MEKFAVKAEEADRALAEVQMKTFGLSHSVDQLGAQRKQVLAEIVKAEVVVRHAHEKERSLDSTINGEFTAYEKVAAQMKLVDMEEMVRLQKPTEILLATMYATGILFDLFDDRVQFQLDQLLKSKPWPTQQQQQLQLPSSTSSSVAIAEDPAASMPTLSLAFILEAKSIWFPVVSTFLRGNMREALRRLQTYSRAKIHLELSQPLFAKVMEMIQVFKMLAYQAAAQAAAAAATGGATKKPFSSSSAAASAAQRSAEKAASKAARAERRRQRRQSHTVSGDSSLPASPPPASPPTRSSQRSPSPNGGARKRISFTPGTSSSLPSSLLLSASRMVR